MPTKSTEKFEIKGTTLVKYKGKNEVEVVVPEGITEIGKDAFNDCKTIERVIMPSTLVTIGEKAFFSSSVKYVDIPNNVETVKNLAFACCRQLEKVTLGASVKRMGYNVFDCASALQTVVLNEGLTEIDRSAFGECKKLSSIQLPRSLCKIPARAFDRCYELQNVVIHSDIREIGEYAFSGCDISTFMTEEGSPFHIVDGCLIDTANKKLIAGCPKSIIPRDGSVTSIASSAFCSDDYEGYPITIPLAITEIEQCAFSMCQNLVIKCEEDEDDEPVGWEEQWYEHPEPWDEGWYEDDIPIVKWGCMPPEDRAEKERKIREREEAEERFRLSQLNDYVRENGVMTKYVGEGGEIVIPPDVKIIRAHAFDDCDNITSLKIHYFVEFFETNSFERFKDAEFYFQADKLPKGFGKSWYKQEKLHFGFMTEKEHEEVEQELIRRRKEYLALRGFEVQGKYLRKYNGSDENIVLPYYDVTTVSREAFKNNDKIKSVHFGSIDTVWDYAFDGCVNLEKVVLPDTVTQFSNAVFRDCEKLNIERFPALLKSVGGGALSNTAIEHVELNVYFIGDGAFSRCKKLKKAVINYDGHCDLRWQAFHDCCNLEEVELNYASKDLDWSVFEGCRSLKRVKLPQNIQIIGDAAFKDCTRLSSIDIPPTVTEIRSQAFLNCKALKNLTIPDSVTEIGDGAFLGCSSLTVRTTITLPKRFKGDLRRIFGEWKDPFQFNDGPIFKFI